MYLSDTICAVDAEGSGPIVLNVGCRREPINTDVFYIYLCTPKASFGVCTSMPYNTPPVNPVNRVRQDHHIPHST